MTDPRTTVIVPTFDRPEAIGRCLQCLAHLTPPPGGYEVVVVDDGGTGRFESPQVAAGWTALRIVRTEHGGPAAARNAGAATARGELLAFTDDDCLPDRDWLVRLLDALGDADAVGGPLVNVIADDAWSTTSQVLLDRLYDWYNRDPRDARFLASSNLMVRCTAFEAIRGFDVSFPAAAAEDRDLCQRLREAGRVMAFAPDAAVGHAHALGLGGFWRQHVAYGRGAARFHNRRSDRTGERLQVESLRFYRHLLRGDPRLAVRITIAQLANALGAALEWRHVRP